MIANTKKQLKAEMPQINNLVKKRINEDIKPSYDDGKPGGVRNTFVTSKKNPLD